LASRLATVIWLDRPEDRRMRLHAVLGDWLWMAAPNGAFAWFTADGIRTQDKPGMALIRLRYQSCDADGSIEICLGRHPKQVAAALVDLRLANTPSAAERRWRQFTARFGAFPRAADRHPTAEETAPFRGTAVRVRRPVHPSAVIDRLMLRDRLIAGDALERLLTGASLRRPVSGAN
jgi:hypothetical protein